MSVAETMRAWRVHEYGDPLEVLQLETVEVPVPEAGEVRVRVQAIPLNLNDLERITGGNMMAPPEFPYSPGMEVMGVVDACGGGAEAWMGRRVVATTRRAYGGFAEQAICTASAVFDMPDDIALVGVQPELLDDYGGSLRDSVKAQLAPAISMACDVLAEWGVSAVAREDAPSVNDLVGPGALDIHDYEHGRPFNSGEPL